MNIILKKAIDTYGEDMQLNVAIEEFSELTKEICKHKRGKENTEAIIEEMADCYIMLEQMKMIFGIGSTVISDEISRKISRLEHRLNSEEECESELTKWI
jgi:predicted DNA-binding protein